MDMIRQNEWKPCTPAVTEYDVREFPIVFVQYWATWNIYDQGYEVLLSDLRNKYAQQISFRSCDVDDPATRKLCNGISNVPAIAIFVNGLRHSQMVGMRKIDVIQGFCEIAAKSITR